MRNSNIDVGYVQIDCLFLDMTIINYITTAINSIS